MAKKRIVVSLAVAVGLVSMTLLTACGGGGDGPTEDSVLTAAEVEFGSFELVNIARGESGSPRVGWNDAVAAVARQHSKAMRDQGFFAHAGPDGKGLRARLRSGGVRFSKVAENLVQVSHPQHPEAVAHQELMASSEHRGNILNQEFQLAGVGVAKNGSTFWITQIFLKP